jgi:hypothetical protein
MTEDKQVKLCAELDALFPSEDEITRRITDENERRAKIARKLDEHIDEVVARKIIPALAAYFHQHPQLVLLKRKFVASSEAAFGEVSGFQWIKPWQAMVTIAIGPYHDGTILQSMRDLLFRSPWGSLDGGFGRSVKNGRVDLKWPNFSEGRDAINALFPEQARVNADAGEHGE